MSEGTTKPRRLLAALSVGLLLAGAGGTTTGCANFDPSTLGNILGGANGGLDEGTVAAGLRQALEVGTGRAVDRVSAIGGFLDDPLIRVPLPDELESAAANARRFGLGGYVDEFETKMNRAAEAASGEAVGVFANAIRQMTIADAMGILNGPDDAATQYFRAATEDELNSRFRPIVNGKMEEMGAVAAWNQIQDAWNTLPLGDKPELDLTGYITNRTLSGVFTRLADEEGRIREDPAARTTELLRTVFSEITRTTTSGN